MILSEHMFRLLNRHINYYSNRIEKTFQNSLNLQYNTNYEQQTNQYATLSVLQCFRSGVPNLGYMCPHGYICLSEGVHLRLLKEENIFT